MPSSCEIWLESATKDSTSGHHRSSPERLARCSRLRSSDKVTDPEVSPWERSRGLSLGDGRDPEGDGFETMLEVAIA